MEDGVLKINGAQEPAPDRYTSLATIKFIAGLQTQRSAFASIDTRYNTKFLGGKPDALIAGSNVEITNSLTLARRPGLIPYGVSNIPAPVAFFDWELATTTDIILVIDTEGPGGDNVAGSNGAVFNYSPTSSGIYVNKANMSGQTNFMDVVNTLYMGDGVDLYKIVGPNLLMWSNTFGTGAGTSFSINSPWTEANVFALTGGQADPLGGTAATQVTWGATGSGAYIQQYAQGGSGVSGPTAPNYTPVTSNTFTFSVWMKGAGETVTIQIIDQSEGIAQQVCVLTNSWVKYQVTATMLSSSTEVGIRIIDPTSDAISMNIYGAQLEVGGPATTTQITTTKPQGVYLWGILAPTVTPTFTSQDAVGNTGLPWQPNHVYHVGDTIVDTNGNLEYATNDGLFSGNIASPEISFALASVASSTGVYTFTSPEADSAGNGLAGALVTITGFTNAANNVQVTITASNSTTFTTTNFASVNETHAATATFGVPGSVAGTSGSTVPTWNTQQGQLTPDGVQGFLVQSNAASNNGGGALSVAFVNNVQNANTIVVCLLVGHPNVPAVTDSAGDSFTSGLNSSNGGVNPGSSGDSRNAAVVNGQYAMYVFYCLSAAGGATTVSVSDAGENVYMAIAEVSNITALDHANSFARNTTSVNGGAPAFQTGGITTTNSSDLIMTFGGWLVALSAGASADIGTPPSTYTTMTSLPPTSQSNNLVNVTTAYDKVQGIGFYNPAWTTTNPSTGAGNYGELGITGAFKTNVGTLQWYNLGENGAGLTAAIGFQWYYAYGNSYTGHFSNVSPISVTSGPVIGQDFSITGATQAMTNPGSALFTPAQWAAQVPWATDPQSDLIAVYRNTDGGGFFYQVALFGNGAVAQAALELAKYPDLTTATSTYTSVTYGTGTWTLSDITPDVDLNTEIFAPIGLLNSIPPAGLVNLEFFEGRMWGSVNNILYYNTSADNASLLSVQQNGVPSESWIPINYQEFNSFITRSIAVGGGLLVCTRLDIWLDTGQNLLTGGFNPQKELAGHGLRSYNAATLDGSTVYLYTSDREFLCINPNSGSVEFGYPIGDFLEENYSPLNVYIVRHVSGSRDNAVFMADGSSSWFRLNPNQQGASMSGEQTPVWSPEAQFQEIGGIGAIASIETSAGETNLLVGQASSGPSVGYGTPYFNYEDSVTFDNHANLTTDFQPSYGTWQGNHTYTVNTVIVDSNGNVQRVTAVSGAGTSGGSTPTWAATVGGITVDNEVTWTAKIYAISVGDTIIAPSYLTAAGSNSISSVTDSSGNTWAAVTPLQVYSTGNTFQTWSTICTANIAYGSALSITFTFSVTTFSGNVITLVSFSGLDAPSAYVSNNGTGVESWSSGSLSINSHTVLFSVSLDGASQVPTSPWAALGTLIAYYNPAVAGTYSDAWTNSTNSTWASSLIAFPVVSGQTAIITAVEWAAGIATYFATNSFTQGQTVTISGLQAYGGIFNLSGVIVAANGTSFEVALATFPMSISQFTSGTGSGTSTSVTLPEPVSVGDIIAVIFWSSTAGEPTIADSLSNSYVELSPPPFNQEAKIWCVSRNTPVTVNGTCTITVSGSSATSTEICVVVLRGGNPNSAGSFIGGTEGSTGSPISVSELNGVPTAPNFIFGFGSIGGTGQITNTDGYTLLVATTHAGIDYSQNNTNTDVTSSWSQTGASGKGSQAGVFATGPLTSIATISDSGTALVGQAGGLPAGLPVLVRDLDIFSDNGITYPWSATIGSILLTTPGKVAEADSITTEMNDIDAAATQCGVAVLLDEIAGTFEALTVDCNDPPQLSPSVSVTSNRFYLNQGAVPPTCRHIQVQLTGGTQTTKDEVLAVTIRGALVPEQL